MRKLTQRAVLRLMMASAVVVALVTLALRGLTMPWSEEGLLQITRNVAATSIALTAPDAIYLGVDTVDDMDELRTELAKILPAEHIPPLFVVNDYIERVYLGEMAICLQKLRDPSYHSLGVTL